MSLIYKPGRRRVIIAAILSLGLGIASSCLYAQENPDKDSVSTQVESVSIDNESESPAAATPLLDRKRVYGGDLEAVDPEVARERLRSEAPTPLGVFSKILIFLILLTALTYAVVHYARKGKLNIGALRAYSADERLIVSETRMLGNRQYLMVVEYGNQKMLLGVAQGSIQHLCFLESGYEDEAVAAMEGNYTEEDGGVIG